jgi:hypothetical protein
MTDGPGRGEPATAEGAGGNRSRWPLDAYRLTGAAPYMVLAGLFTLVYLAHPALPGNNLDHPQGWWGWWDQSLYLRSAQALGRLTLSPEAHWYPLGYSLLGAPWTRIVPTHPFFFVNLFCLFGAFFCFVRIGRAMGISDGVAGVVFIGAIAADWLIFWQFVIPWNTTPVMLYVYLALAVTLHSEPLDLRSTVMAAICAALVFVTRPSDMVIMAPIGLALIVRVWRDSPPVLALGRLAGGALAAGVVCLAYGLLHTRIYGFAPSPYMVHSGAIGLNLADLPRKLYAVLVDPKPFYGEGQGILQRAPWMILALPALPLAVMKRSVAAGLLWAVVAVNVVFYASYTDFLPHGIWRYNNIHYLKVSYPLVGLLAVYVVVNLLNVRAALVAGVTILAALSLDYRVLRGPIAAHVVDEHTIAVSLPSPRVESLVLSQGKLDYKNVYFEDNVIRANGSPLRNIYDFRSIPVEGQIYLVFFRPLAAPQFLLTFKAPHGFPVSEPVAVTGGKGAFRLRWPRLP